MSPGTPSTNPQLAGVPETLLIPLWARAEEQSHSDPILIDPDSARIVNALDYDFDQFKTKRVEAENFCIRAKVLDDLITRILEASPGRTVIEFGPGLDTRFRRLGHLAERWVEVDFPEVIALRERFLPPDPKRTVIGCSMLDEQWIEEVAQTCSEPPLFIAEGVFYFFSHDQIQEFLKTLKGNFPDASIVFDAVSSSYLKLSNLRHPLSTSRLQFALSANAAEITKWDPDMVVSDYVGYGDSPFYDGLMHRFAWWKRAAVRLIPSVRHAFMILNVSWK